MSTKHRPGPWREGVGSFGSWSMSVPDGPGVASLILLGATNAKLIAAAPEMAEALQALLERYAPGRTSNDLWVQQARAALAKAGL